MTRPPFFLLLGTLICSAQSPSLSDLPWLLNLETEQTVAPKGWWGGPAGTMFADDKIFHSGKWSARIERKEADAAGFSTLTSMIPMDFAGKSIELRGFIRTEDVSEFAGLWMREDGATTLAFDNMQRRQLKGTTDWTEYSIVLPLRDGARQLFFGFLVAGTGKAWVDDMQLLVDGKPVWEAPKAERPKTILETDHEFDRGSGVTAAAFSPVQVENLVTLGKVWGFLKYHHPAVTAGRRQWDYDLFRAAPAILRAQNRSEANAALLEWIDGLGEVAACSPCASLDRGKLHFGPDLGWISDEALLGKELSGRLLAVHKNRTTGEQFYVSQVRGVGNPIFDRELPYAQIQLPDAGFQLVAVYRFWSIVQYWFPYRDVLGEDWNKVLAEFIPRVALAKTTESYQRELMALIARAHDTHANLGSAINVRPPVGQCRVPVLTRFIENQAVVTGYVSEAGKSTGLKVGDVIAEIDGKPVAELVANWTPYYADSNEAARQRDMARSLTRGDCGPAALRVRRESESVEVKTARVRPSTGEDLGVTHDIPGDAFRLLAPDIAYMKLATIKSADLARYVDAAAGVKGLIIDNRNYPGDFTVFTLGQLLVSQETPFARFTGGDLSNPGAFAWGDTLLLKPEKLHFAGKVVILVDEVTQSSAEYHSMAFRSAPGATVIGSMTAGADGNVSPFALPGGQRSMVSGIGVFYPDKRPTQRVGIIPDVQVKPTIAGVKAGRDEVLEAAVRQILGPDVSASEIENLVKKLRSAN